MKKIILSILTFLISLLSHSQLKKRDFYDVFQPSAAMLDLSKFTNRYQTIALNNERFVLNVKVHLALDTNAGNGFNLNEALVHETLGLLNEKFNSQNIYFKYRGYDILAYNNPAALNSDATCLAMKQEFVNNGLYDDNSINIFVGRGSNYSVLGSDKTDLYVYIGAVNTTYYSIIVPQLMGHALSLLEIESNTQEITLNDTSYPCMLPDPNMRAPTFVFPATNIENVTRLDTDVNFNADITGDRVTDTQACFNNFFENYCTDNVILNNYQTYYNIWASHPNVVDYVGQRYECTAIESHNVMATIPINATFTPFQGRRMKEYIEGNMNIFRQKLNVFEDDSPDVSVLYEPFVTRGGNNTGNSSGITYSKTATENSTFTGMNVWNCGPFTLRFQTGFNCEFTKIVNAATTAFSTTIYQQHNSTNVNCLTLKIPILGQDIYTICEPLCFNSYEPFTSGSLLSTTNIGSSNYTLEQLDTIKATNPALYEQLQSGQYHFITKSTDSGITKQKVIFKN